MWKGLRRNKCYKVMHEETWAKKWRRKNNVFNNKTHSPSVSFWVRSFPRWLLCKLPWQGPGRLGCALQLEACRLLSVPPYCPEQGGPFTLFSFLVDCKKNTASLSPTFLGSAPQETTPTTQTPAPGVPFFCGKTILKITTNFQFNIWTFFF